MSDYSLAQVMRAIGSREDVPHMELVLIRKRVIYVYQRAVQLKKKVSPGQVAVAMLSYLEHGVTPLSARRISVNDMIRRAQRIAKTPPPNPLPTGGEGEQGRATDGKNDTVSHLNGVEPNG